MQMGKKLTLVKHVTQRAIIQDHNLAQIRLHRTEVLDESAMAKRAVLSIVPGREVPTLSLQPVDHGVGILLHRRRKHHQVEPLADPSQELVAVRPLVDVIQDWVLWPDRGLPPGALVGCVEADLDHVPGAHAAALRHAVDQGFVEVEDERLLVSHIGQLDVLVEVRRLPAWDERSWRRWCFGVLGESAYGGRRRFKLRRDAVHGIAATAVMTTVVPASRTG